MHHHDDLHYVSKGCAACSKNISLELYNTYDMKFFERIYVLEYTGSTPFLHISHFAAIDHILQCLP